MPEAGRTLLDLAGQVAVVTGGTRGIGRATSEALAQQGATVILAGRADATAATAVAAGIAARTGSNVQGVTCDHTQPPQIQALYRKIRAEFGRLDILVNNAGILSDALLGMISQADMEQVFAVNTIGPIEHMQQASRLMRRGGGRIVNVSSIVGRVGNSGQVSYGASKAAVIGMTLSAAKELAPRGIRVNAVAPGFIDTDMTTSLPPDKHTERLGSIKMGRIGTPDEVADVILFLVSDLARYVTGQVIGVDGGMLL